METHSRISFIYLLYAIAVLYVAELVRSMAILIAAIVKKWEARDLLKMNMMIKLIHIPAYLILFFQLYIRAIIIMSIVIMSHTGTPFQYNYIAPYILAFFIPFCMIIFLTGLIGTAGVIRAYKEKRLSKGSAIIFGILQFAFFLDVIFSVIAYITVKRREEHEQPCPICGANPKSVSVYGQKICDNCRNLRVEDNVPLHFQPELLDATPEEKEIELQKMLERYKHEIEMYKLRGVIDPNEIESLNMNYFNNILALSPGNMRVRFLKEQLSAIEYMPISGIIRNMKLEKNGILSITKKSSGEVIYNQPLEKVVILSVWELLLILPGIAVFSTPGKKVAAKITFAYLANSKSEMRNLIQYISKVAQVPNMG